jgi:nitroreductase
MELKKVIEQRTSVRSFKDETIPLENIKEMVRLAGLAPSVNNFQPWHFILIQNKGKLKELAELVSEKYKAFPVKNSKISQNVKNQVEWYSTFFKDAPALLVLVVDEYESVWEKGVDLSHEEINKMRNHPDIQSSGACIQNLLLAAVDMGYGACWLSGPMVAKAEIELLLGIQKPESLLSFVALGKPTKDFKPKEKMNLAEKLEIIS